MLHVLLMILKIVGWILAALFLLLLFLLLIFLFVPVRYQAFVSKKESVQAEVKVTWLLRILSFLLSFRDGSLSIKIKVFGLPLKAPFGERPEKADMKEEEEEREMEKPRENLGLEDKVLEEKLPSREEPPLTAKVKEASPDLTLSEERVSWFYKIWSRLSDIFAKIRNLKYTFQRFCVKMKQIGGKAQGVKEFLKDERTKAALALALSQVRVLLLHLLPKKLRGEIRFGTSDPALTGEILGGISIFYPVFMDNVKVTPEFEKTCLEGELFVKGRFRLVTVALIAIKLLINKNIRFVFRKLSR